MIIYGKQLFFYLLEHQRQRLRKIYLAKECDRKLFSKIAALKIPIVKLDAKRAQAMAKGGNHQGFLAEIEPLECTPLDAIKGGKFIVVLYGLTDMGNIGAICRSAYAFGADGVVVANIRQLQLEAIARTSSGAIFELPLILAPDGLSVLNELNQAGFTLYGADASGENVKNIEFENKKALVLGAEGEGIPAKALMKCNKKIAISMARAFDSLNVSAAAAVLCDRMTNG
jgi:23S rRNA (guanosine2251-2'-O)-methyltransferase